MQAILDWKKPRLDLTPDELKETLGKSFKFFSIQIRELSVSFFQIDLKGETSEVERSIMFLKKFQNTRS